MAAAEVAVMLRRWMPMLATVTLAGCLCKDTRVTRTAYASMASYHNELTACVVNQACVALCSAVFQLDGDVDIESCDLISLDAAAPPASGSATPDPQQLRGAMVRVSYIEHAACVDDGFDGWFGGDDGGYDDGSDDGYDDGSDDGSCDDGSCDDGGYDDGSDDGSGDDGSGTGDDGGGDDGGGDDGGGDVTGGGTSIRPVPGPTLHGTPAPHASR